MAKKRRSNPLALAVMVLLFERPMHPYEMATTLKQRHKHDSIKIRFGSLYTVIDALSGRRTDRAPGDDPRWASSREDGVRFDAGRPGRDAQTGCAGR